VTRLRSSSSQRHRLALYSRSKSRTHRLDGDKQPYTIDFYAEADTSTNSPIETLLVWFWHMLTGPGGDFQILQTTVADTNDWGLACKIMHYCKIDNNITALAVKLEGYQHDIDAAWASLMSCESCLMLACTMECVEPL
jgi:hypothetical protein